MTREESERRATISKDEIDSIVAKAVKETLIQLGVDASKPLEMQKDFQHLRSWRESTDSIKSKGLLAAIAFIVVGALGLMWSGLLSKHL